MLEKLPFYSFLLSAWRASFSKKLPWIFGSLLAIAGILENRFGSTLPDTTSFSEFLHIITENSPQTLFFFVLIFIFLFCLEIFGKSNLIVSLSFVTDKTNLPNHPNNLIALVRNFFRTFILECLTLLFLLAIVLIFSLPLLIASSQNPNVINSLLSLSILTFIPIAIATFFVKQFALFYLLLSPLQLRGSIETSGALFSRFVLQSLFFGLFSLILTILFTFCVNTIILSLVALSKKIGSPFTEISVTLIVSLLSFAWFGIFQQALWLAFFKFIASPPKPAVADSKETEEFSKEKEAALDNHTLPEIPPAQ